MSHKLYRKLYLYAVATIFASVGLTILTVFFLFHRDEQSMRHQYLTRQASFAQYIISQTPHPLALPMQIDSIGSFLHWHISLWQNDQCLHFYGQKLDMPTQRYIDQLIAGQSPVIFNQYGQDFILTYLNPLYPSAGYLVMSPPQRPWRSLWRNRQEGWSLQSLNPSYLFGLLIFVFLALLLIPYSRFIIKPFKELNASIERVAAGDFSPVRVSSKSEFGAIANAFNHMTEQIRLMIHQKQRLIADVSHELRSPLTRMRLSLEMLAKEGKGNSKYINRSIEELEQLDRMIEEILDVSSLELDKTQYPLVQLDLRTLLKDNLESHQLIFDSQALKIHETLPLEPIMIQGNPTLLKRAFNNLFSNLVKYAPQNSQVDITLSSNKDQASLVIRDRGPGVREQEYEKIFEPFFRTDDSRSRKTGGTGLGLAIVKQIMHHHQGQIKASAPPAGDEEGGLVLTLNFKQLLV